MTSIFISHSRHDDALATSLEMWLRHNGFSDLFIDHNSIVGGQSWRKALRDASAACRVVILVVTPAWLKSHECFGEFEAAWYMGKRIIPLLALPSAIELAQEGQVRLARVMGEDQGIDIEAFLDGDGRLDFDRHLEVSKSLSAGLRAAGALTRIGLDPEAFAIDFGSRPTPFPGLASFGDDDTDAALFYGRSQDIAKTLEWLRQMRANNERCPLVILGASGAGKSSLLRAGIIPRLRRETPAWLPLRAFRPGADPLLNFAEALGRTYSDFNCAVAYGAIRDKLLIAWKTAPRDASGALTDAGREALGTALDAEGQPLRQAANRAGASILISIDQAEELTQGDSVSSAALTDYLRVAQSLTNTSWHLAFTIRTDHFPELQAHPRFQNLEARGYDLRALPHFQFDNVVVEPAKRYGVEIDPALVLALMNDAPQADALPLLAFAMDRLWRLYALTGHLTKANYDGIVGLQGLVEDAAERALRSYDPRDDRPLPAAPLSNRLNEIGRTTFIPTLVKVNDQGLPIRHTAQWQAFSEEQRELVGRLVDWRLLVHNGGDGGGTVEVVHESLFRTWKRLESWLAPEQQRLEALRALQIDSGNWERSGRNKEFVIHRGKRLEDALAFKTLPAYRAHLGDRDVEYLSACGAAERREQAERATLVRLRAIAAGLGACLMLLSVTWLLYQLNQQQLHEFVFRLRHITSTAPSIETARQFAPLHEFADCTPACPTMVVVAAGHFRMGSERDDYPKDTREFQFAPKPVHTVTIAKKFSVSKFTITFPQYDACSDASACAKASSQDWGRGEKDPVVNVSWDDGKAYVAWLSRTTGRDYRLLTEAEWEYAARAGAQQEYWWGDDFDPQKANCDGCIDPDGRNPPRWANIRTAPIDAFPPNPFGLHQMTGNVWQWVEDCYDDYAKKPEHLKGSGAAVQREGCFKRVTRGGAWGYSATALRSAFRYKNSPGDRNDDMGLRVARDID